MLYSYYNNKSTAVQLAVAFDSICVLFCTYSGTININNSSYPKREHDSDATTPPITFVLFHFVGVASFCLYFLCFPLLCEFLCFILHYICFHRFCLCEGRLVSWVDNDLVLVCIFESPDASPPGMGHGWRKQQPRERRDSKVSDRLSIVGTTCLRYSYHKLLQPPGGCSCFVEVCFGMPVLSLL